jgi:hypothetical protein
LSDQLDHRLSINRPTNRGKEKSRSDGHYQCEKEMDDLVTWQQHFEIEPRDSDKQERASFLNFNDIYDISVTPTFYQN